MLPIIAASLIRVRRGALQVAALSACCYTALVVGQYVEPRTCRRRGCRDAEPAGGQFAAIHVGINVVGFFAVALLAGSLAEGCGRTGAQLGRRVARRSPTCARSTSTSSTACVSGLVTADADGRILTLQPCGRGDHRPRGRHAASGGDARDVLQLPASVRERARRRLDEPRSHARGLRATDATTADESTSGSRRRRWRFRTAGSATCSRSRTSPT